MNGTWRSNLELSMQFNLSKSALEPRQVEFLKQVLGRMTIEISNGRFELCEEDRVVTIGGKTMPWEGAKGSGTYTVIFENADTVIATYRWPDDMERPSIIHFVDEDTYWMYMGDNPGVVDLHAREYFTRIRDGGCKGGHDE